MDAWLLLRDVEAGGERNRVMYVLKSRGMAHSNQVREFRLTGHGVELVDVYVGTGNVLTGSARLVQQAREAEDEVARRDEIEAHEAALARKRAALHAQIEALRAELAAEEVALAKMRSSEERRRARAVDTSGALAQNRWADGPVTSKRKTATTVREEA